MPRSHPCCISAGGSLGKRQHPDTCGRYDFYGLFVCPVLQFSEEICTGAVNENHWTCHAVVCQVAWKNTLGGSKRGILKKKKKRWMALFWCEARARCHSQIPQWERSFHQCRLSPPYLTPSRLKKIPLPVEPSRVTWRQCKQKQQVVLMLAKNILMGEKKKWEDQLASGRFSWR